MISVFQTDSKIVNDVYRNKDNYYIEFDKINDKSYCAIYFSSNYIYFPNDVTSFTNSIINENRYEWVNQKLEYACKHIFLRDIKKQWYLTGINHELNNPPELLKFLKLETKKYRVITIGSSAGGYAAVLYGQLLNAEKIYCFNAQFELSSLLSTSNESIDPIIFRHRSDQNLLPFYDLRDFITAPQSIYYFVSSNSNWDNSEYNHIKDLRINTIFFKTRNHGIPFPKVALRKLFSLRNSELNQLINKFINPIIFSINMAGFFQTVRFLIKVMINRFTMK